MELSHDPPYNYTTNCIEENTCQFQINKAIVKLSNVSAVPNAPIAELYRFVENIVENVDQNQHIVTTSDLNFDMLQHSNLQKELFIFMKHHNVNLHTTVATTPVGSLLDHFWETFETGGFNFHISEAYSINHHSIWL